MHETMACKKYRPMAGANFINPPLCSGTATCNMQSNSGLECAKWFEKYAQTKIRKTILHVNPEITVGTFMWPHHRWPKLKM